MLAVCVFWARHLSAIYTQPHTSWDLRTVGIGSIKNKMAQTTMTLSLLLIFMLVGTTFVDCSRKRGFEDDKDNSNEDDNDTEEEESEEDDDDDEDDDSAEDSDELEDRSKRSAEDSDEDDDDY
ncbi:hypothetical protein B566_EDAN004038 [Ephemera danica]|nr:hypothetical protein B566_EDAN004038 [Ephemera danica]